MCVYISIHIHIYICIYMYVYILCIPMHSINVSVVRLPWLFLPAPIDRWALDMERVAPTNFHLCVLQTHFKARFWLVHSLLLFFNMISHPASLYLRLLSFEIAFPYVHDILMTVIQNCDFNIPGFLLTTLRPHGYNLEALVPEGGRPVAGRKCCYFCSYELGLSQPHESNLRSRI